MGNTGHSIASTAGAPEWPTYVPRQEALKVLGVKPQTLYSYVSRGLIRRQFENGGRSSAYNFQDIQRLKARSLARSGHGPAAANAIHWGEPVLGTAITEITAQGPRYREHLATDLARRSERFECVAAYLWTGTGLGSDKGWPQSSHARLGRQLDEIARLHPKVHIRQLLTETAILLGMNASESGNGIDGELAAARSLMQAMVGVFGFLGARGRYVAPRARDTLAGGLARALGLRATPAVARALDALLIVVADHEFTPATFAARIAASAGNDLYSCIGAALQVHFGSALGLRCDQVERSLSAGTERSNLPARPSRGLDPPFYRDGDPRAEMLLDIAASLRPRPHGRTASAQPAVNLDHALVTICHALGVSGQVAGGLLAFGRTAGWIAHVFEQRAEAFVIRPRAKFIEASSRSAGG
jgi:citrate synthase